MRVIPMAIYSWFHSIGLSSRIPSTVKSAQDDQQHGEEPSQSAVVAVPKPASTTTFKRIFDADVKRDASGFWRHPEFLHDDEGEPETFQAWLDTHRLTTLQVLFQEDGSAEQREELASGGPCATDCSKWEPSKPKGNGWFILDIWDSEDGPVCLWARYIEIAELEQQANSMSSVDMLSLTFIHVPHPLFGDPAERGEVTFNYGIEDYDVMVKDGMGNKTLAFMLRAALLEQGWCILNGVKMSVKEEINQWEESVLLLASEECA